MRTCEQYREWIPASIDRRLDARETGALASHLAACPDCRRAHEEIESGDALLRRRERIELPPGFADSVVAASKSASPARASWLAPVVPCAIAAALLVVLGLTLALPGGPTPSARRELAEHMGKTSTVAETAASLPGADPSREAEFMKAFVGAFDLDRPPKELQELARYNVDVRAYLGVSHEMTRLARAGDVLGLQVLAREHVVEKAARNVQVKLHIEALELRDIVIDMDAVQPEYRKAALGRWRLAQGDPHGAIQALDAAVHLAPTRFWRAEAKAAQGNAREALLEYCLAVEAAPHAKPYVMMRLRDSAARHAATVDFLDGEFVMIYADLEEVVVAGPEDDARVRSLLMLDNIHASRRQGAAYAAFRRALLAEMTLPESAQWLRRAVPAYQAVPRPEK